MNPVSAGDSVTDGRLLKGKRKRESILREAVEIASQEGLEGLSIGRLAQEIGMSKSGLFAHFGSKEGLQMAVVEQAAEIFKEHVIEPVKGSQRGLPRLTVLLDSWVAYEQEAVFRGGCFFAAASAEFDGRPGPIRDRISELMKMWIAFLTSQIDEARRLGHVDRDCDPDQVAFEMHALVIEANFAFQLLECSEAFDRARKGIESRLKLLAQEP